VKVLTKISGILTVCFDIDWTLVKHSEDIENNVLRSLGIEPNVEFSNQVKYFWDNLSNNLQNGKKVEKSKIYKLASEMIPFLRKINLSAEEWYYLSEQADELSLIDGAYEILEYLQEQGYSLVASTNWFVKDQTNVLRNLKILDFFDRIFGWDTICAKPHKNALYSLMSMHTRDSIIFIGDSVYNDIYFANKTKVKSIGYNLKYNERNGHIKPTAHVSNLSEIKKYL
jgi:2-haloacid dehalogenase